VDQSWVWVVKGQELHLSLPDVMQPSWDELLVPVLSSTCQLISLVVGLKLMIIFDEDNCRWHGSRLE
jgi:hypothetical protein